MLTLVLVLLAGVALTAIAQRSSAGAVAVASSKDELQRRWAVMSLQHTLLHLAPNVFDDLDQQSIVERDAKNNQPWQPKAQLLQTVTLSGQQYDLVMADEQTKINVNRLLSEERHARAEALIRDVLHAQRVPYLGSNRVRIRSLKLSTREGDSDNAFLSLGSFDQVFNDPMPAELLGTARRPGASNCLTCWGSMQLNIRRTPDSIVQLALQRHVPQDVVDLLINARNESPSANVSTLIKGLGPIDVKHQNVLKSRLTETSSCYSIWTVARGPQRDWFALAVGQFEQPGQLITWREFSW